MLEIESATGATPQALLDRPRIHGVLSEVCKAYDVLAARRTAGMTLNPIQLSEIDAYIRLYGEPSIPIDVFIDLIGTADLQYLDLANGNKSAS